MYKYNNKERLLDLLKQFRFLHKLMYSELKRSCSG